MFFTKPLVTKGLRIKKTVDNLTKIWYNITMIREKTISKEIVIDLTGPDGNAFALLGTAIRLGKQLGLDTDIITSEMKTGDYENLVEVFDRHFGHFIILER